MIAIVTNSLDRAERLRNTLGYGSKEAFYISNMDQLHGYQPKMCVYIEPILDYDWATKNWVEIRDYCYSHCIPIFRFNEDEGWKGKRN